MRKTQGKPVAVAGAVALVVATSSWMIQAAGEEDAFERQDRVAVPGRGAEDQWNTFSALVTIRRSVLNADERPLAERTPPVTYLWERTQSGQRWKTTMTFMTGTRPGITTPSGATESLPPDIVRIEDDGDGEGPRFVTRQGVVVRGPAVADRRKLSTDDTLFEKTDALLRASTAIPAHGLKAVDPVRGWVDTVLLSAGQKQARRATLQRRFGAAASLRGMSRYVATSGGNTTELLVDNEWSAVREINVVRDGRLLMHGSFAYQPGPGGALLRRTSHVEQALADGKRSVIDVELASVQLEDRR